MYMTSLNNYKMKNNRQWPNISWLEEKLQHTKLCGHFYLSEKVIIIITIITTTIIIIMENKIKSPMETIKKKGK